MKKQKICYREGNLFLVPLRDHGFICGLICRMDGRGVVFGHFFAPRIHSKTAHLSTDDLMSSNVLLSGFFGDLGLTKGEWPIVGELSKFDRKYWRLPAFVREMDGQIFIREFNDSLELLSEYKAMPDTMPVSTCRDSVMGYGYVEIRLTKLLSADKEEP